MQQCLLNTLIFEVREWSMPTGEIWLEYPEVQAEKFTVFQILLANVLDLFKMLSGHA